MARLVEWHAQDSLHLKWRGLSPFSYKVGVKLSFCPYFISKWTLHLKWRDPQIHAELAHQLRFDLARSASGTLYWWAASDVVRSGHYSLLGRSVFLFNLVCQFNTGNATLLTGPLII
jgi:hypothetical protein